MSFRIGVNMSARPPKAVAGYYSKLTGTHKETILEMRTRILAVIPGAEEVIKYGMPTFLYEGNAVAGLMSHTKHIGYYPYAGIAKNFPAITKKYKTTTGAIHIPLGKPLAKSEVKILINARIRACAITRGEVDLSKYDKVDGEWKKLGIAAPARRALINAKLFAPKDLKKIRKSELEKLHGMGPKALHIIGMEAKKRSITFKK